MGLMEWTAVLGNFGEFVGAIAILVTLVYLAIQIRQTNNLLASQARYNLYERRSAVSSANQDPFVLESLIQLNAGGDVTDVQVASARMTAGRMIELWEWQYSEHEAGLLQKEQLPIGSWSSFYHDSDLMPAPVPIQQVWLQRRATLNPRFVTFFEQEVAKAGP